MWTCSGAGRNQYNAAAITMPIAIISRTPNICLVFVLKLQSLCAEGATAYMQSAIILSLAGQIYRCVLLLCVSTSINVIVGSQCPLCWGCEYLVTIATIRAQLSRGV